MRFINFFDDFQCLRILYQITNKELFVCFSSWQTGLEFWKWTPYPGKLDMILFLAIVFLIFRFQQPKLNSAKDKLLVGRNKTYNFCYFFFFYFLFEIIGGFPSHSHLTPDQMRSTSAKHSRNLNRINSHQVWCSA